MSGSRAKALKKHAKRNAKGEIIKSDYRRLKREWSQTGKINQ